MLKEFREFILKGNAFDLAVGVIIGAAFSAVVASLVGDIIMPPIGFIMGGIDFSSYFLDLTALAKRAAGEQVALLPSIDAAKQAGHAVIAYGRFLNAVINLIIVGAIIFLLVKQMNKLKREPAKPAEKPEDVRLLTEIRDLLGKNNVSSRPAE